jgi:hypothetical protein
VEEMNIVVTGFDGFRPVTLTNNLNPNISIILLMIIGDTTQRG